ncbi:MAG: inositol phosphorylceramide synthase [Ilumatobacteraceae bacterium]|nr:inositol phosphorylceramide synthase [Ilumatobacteraceae bacterium]
MPWPTWQEAATAAVVLTVLSLALRRVDRRDARVVAAFAQEVALISFLYMLWRLARQLPLLHEEGAIERGQWIFDFQRAIHLPSELSMEQWLVKHHWLAELTVDYYATVHVPGLLCFLVWLWVRHRDQYPRWRNALAITTGFCLFIRFVRVSPPRLTPGHGFWDLSAQLGRDIYGPVGTGASDQFAAMPSIHIAWACIVAFGIWHCANSRWRFIGPLHLVLTFWAVMATANHWWLDGLVAVGLVVLALFIDDGARKVAAAWRARRSPLEQPSGAENDPDPELVPTS